jgi:hypothetical protein
MILLSQQLIATCDSCTHCRHSYNAVGLMPAAEFIASLMYACVLLSCPVATTIHLTALLLSPLQSTDAISSTAPPPDASAST